MKRTPYLISLGIILALSSYPLWMGVKVLAAHFRDGYIVAADYPKYIIPYTPLALALIICAALLPLFIKYGKRFALLIVSLLGVGLFFLAETGFERVTVFSMKTAEGIDIGSWQLALCAFPPQVAETIWRTLGEELAARYTPAFKIHFYLIAILIILAVLGVVYGFLKLTKDRRKPLILQTVAVSVFIALCVFACFTAFYRTGELLISPISALLMSLFFITFGVTAGAYAGALLYTRKPVWARLLPAFIAIATTTAMYIGELILLGGTLYRFGSGFFFAQMGACPLALVDFAVIVLSGALTYSLLFLIRKKEPTHA